MRDDTVTKLEELGWDLADVPEDSDSILIRHVLAKGFQAGSVLGFDHLPILLKFASKRPLSFSQFYEAMCAQSLSFVGGCTFLSGGALFYKYQSMNEVDVIDRAYRLQRNPGQLRTDRYSAYGAVLGAAAGLLHGGVPGTKLNPFYRISGSAAIGAGVGVLTHFGCSQLGFQAQDVPVTKAENP